MNDILDHLNDAQTQAVTAPDGPVLVVAGAGSGKTRVLTTRIAHLLEHGIYPSQVLAFTFTNKAAREMKARVAKLRQGRDSRGLSISTFHTFGLSILRREHALAGYKPGFSILDAQDAETLLKGLLQKERYADAEQAEYETDRGWKGRLAGPQFVSASTPR